MSERELILTLGVAATKKYDSAVVDGKSTATAAVISILEEYKTLLSEYTDFRKSLSLDTVSNLSIIDSINEQLDTLWT